MKSICLCLFLSLFCFVQHASPEECAKGTKGKMTCNKSTEVSVKVQEQRTVVASDVLELTPVSILVLEI